MTFWSKLRRTLFDFSAGQEEGRKIERMLRVALAETTTGEEFYHLLRRMVEEDDLLKSEYRWTLLLQQLSDQWRGGDQDWRPAAQRLLEYLPRHYGYKSNW